MSKNNLSFPSSGARSRTDRALVGTLHALAVVAGAVVVLIFGFLVKESWPVLDEVGIAPFIHDVSWHPTERLFGLMPMVTGTFAVMAGALLLATPLGLASAVFCHFYATRHLLPAYRRAMEVLAGIPSVVYGFWGLVVLVPAINRLSPPGVSLLAGVIVLAVMVLPTIALMADAAFANVPSAVINGAHALGLSKWGVLRAAMLPSARSGLFTAVILATGRAIGETMAVLMVTGNIVQNPASVFDPIRTLTANIALEMAYALGDHRSALFVSGLCLMLMIIALVSAAERLVRGPTDG